MKNVNIFVDVDLTLVDHNQNLIDGVRDALQRLVDRGCHLYLWSSAGKRYAESTALRFDLADLFEGYAPKPDIVIDDMPNTTLPAFVFNPNQEASWDTMVNAILEKHAD